MGLPAGRSYDGESCGGKAPGVEGGERGVEVEGGTDEDAVGPLGRAVVGGVTGEVGGEEQGGG